MRRLMQLILSMIRIGIVLTVCLVAVIALINLWMILTALPQTTTVDKWMRTEHQPPTVLVLGAGVINNETPSRILKLRLDKAYELYQADPRCRLIMSGDHRDDNYNEVAVMKQYLIDRGVPSAQIYLDHAGYSTYDSLYRAHHVFGLDQLVVVTQGYHLSRALALARYIGIDAVGVPAGETTSTRLYRESREVFARLKDFAVIFLGYQPAQPDHSQGIDWSQDGDATNIKRP